MEQIRQIVFTKKNTAELLEKPVPALGDNQVMVRTEISTISCGTERANITGDVNTSVTSEAFEKPRFPVCCGYSSAGTVVKTGVNVTKVKAGDRVCVFWGCHASYNIVPEAQVVKLEDSNISFADAAISFIASFPLAAIRKTRLELGESMLVMGLGILGQLAVKLALSAGAAPVIAADPIEERRKNAADCGADYALDPLAPDFAEKVKEITHGGANTAVEVTGVGAGLDETLDCMAKLGRVSLLGCTRDKNFTIDYYRKVHGPGISLIGAHTLARPDKESYPGYFTHEDDIKSILKLCAAGRLTLADMVEEIHSPADCGGVYNRLVNDRNFPAAVQFDWTRLN